jgi:hypothetical protein
MKVKEINHKTQNISIFLLLRDDQNFQEGSISSSVVELCGITLDGMSAVCKASGKRQ